MSWLADNTDKQFDPLIRFIYSFLSDQKIAADNSINRIMDLRGQYTICRGINTRRLQSVTRGIATAELTDAQKWVLPNREDGKFNPNRF